MTATNETNKKTSYYVNILLVALVVIYEALVIILLYKELIASSMRATEIALILLGLLFLPLLFLLLGKTLGGKRLISFKAGDFQVQIEGLKEEFKKTDIKIEKKAKEFAEQLEGKLSTAEQTLYPLVGGPNTFAAKHLEQNRLIIGSKDFSANIVMAELTAQYLELNGLQCDRRIPNGGTVTNYAALSNGWIDIFIDYTGTGCMLYNLDFHEMARDEILKTLNEISMERFDFEWLVPFGTKTNYCLVMKETFANENHINNISDINDYGLGKLRFCGNYEFMNRLDGFPGLKDKYKLRFLSKKTVSYSERYNYLVSGEADVSVGFTTDPSIRAFNLKVLIDDQQFFPDYFETPLVRSEALTKIKGLRNILNDIKDLHLVNDDITTLIHDYNTNADSLSNSVKKMLQSKM